MSPNDQTDLASWVTAAATILAVVVALFREELRRRWSRPRLDVSIRMRAPDCITGPMARIENGKLVVQGTTCYLRMWVENLGQERAENVQVFVAEVSRQQRAGEAFVTLDNFPRMNLRWSNSAARTGIPEVFADGISPGMGRHCDLAHMVDPQFNAQFTATRDDLPVGEPVLGFDVEAEPLDRPHLVGRGTYRVKLKIAGSNTAPITKTAEIRVTGEWHTDPAKMFGDGLSVRFL